MTTQPQPAWVIEEELSVSHRHPLAPRGPSGRAAPGSHCPRAGRPDDAAAPRMSLSDSVSERLLRERIILLGSEVRDTNANEITAQLLLLAAEDAEKDITLYINSPGGSVTAGMAIYDTMMWIEPDVATTAMGLAASMGQFLLTAGAKGKRAALAAHPDPDAPAQCGRRRYRGRHRHPGGHADQVQARAHRAAVPAHRPVDRAHRDRPGPRPVVHRAGGAGVRVHRQGRRAGPNPAAADAAEAASTKK